jgi:hypothetical protein
MVIKEHTVTVAGQPVVQLGSQQMILTCVTHEYPGHSNLEVKEQRHPETSSNLNAELHDHKFNMVAISVDSSCIQQTDSTRTLLGRK